MADLTSLYSNQQLRDAVIQSAMDSVGNLATKYPNFYISNSFMDLFDIQGGTQPPKSQFIFEPQNGYIRFLQIRDFSSDKTPTFIPINQKNKLCTKNDILLGRYGASVGKILTGKEGAYNVACAKILIINEKVISKNYLFYLLHSSSIQVPLRGITRGAQSGFNKHDLKNIDLHIPKHEFQKQILDILTSVDNHILNSIPLIKISNKNKFINDLYKVIVDRVNTFKSINTIEKNIDSFKLNISILRKAILQEAVQGKLVLQNYSDSSKLKLLEKIKTEKEKHLSPIAQDEIPYKLPKGWIWCRLGEIINFLGGSQPPKNSFIYEEQEGYIRLIQIRDFKSDKYKTYVPNNLAKRPFKEDDVMIGRYGPPVFQILRGLHGTYNVALMKADPDIKFMSKDYVFILLKEPRIQKTIIDESERTAGQTGIRLDLLNNIVFGLPRLDEQEKIVSKVEDLMILCNQLEKRIIESQKNTDLLMQSVLQEAFKGKLSN